MATYRPRFRGEETGFLKAASRPISSVERAQAGAQVSGLWSGRPRLHGASSLLGPLGWLHPASSLQPASHQAPPTTAAGPLVHRDAGGHGAGTGHQRLQLPRGRAPELAKGMLDSPDVGIGEADLLRGGAAVSVQPALNVPGPACHCQTSCPPASACTPADRSCPRGPPARRGSSGSRDHTRPGAYGQACGKASVPGTPTAPSL